MLHLMERWLVRRFYCQAFRLIARAARRRKFRQQKVFLRPVRRSRTIFLLPEEIDLLMACVKNTAHIPGALAEVGVYEGATALVAAHLKGAKSLLLFDTFDGLPEVSGADSKIFRKGQFAPYISYEQIRKDLEPFGAVEFYRGIFPEETGAQVDTRRFSFVHLDVDTYRSTLASLQFFYPRLNPGGILLSHDYLISAGVRRAVDEFFAERPEAVIPAAGTQCLIVKIARAVSPRTQSLAATKATRSNCSAS